MHHLCNSGDLKQSNEEDGDEDSYGDDKYQSIKHLKGHSREWQGRWWWRWQGRWLTNLFLEWWWRRWQGRWCWRWQGRWWWRWQGRWWWRWQDRWWWRWQDRWWWRRWQDRWLGRWKGNDGEEDRELMVKTMTRQMMLKMTRLMMVLPPTRSGCSMHQSNTGSLVRVTAW